MHWFPKYKYILASKSPRRQELLHELGIEFQVKIKDVEEVYPAELPPVEIPVYLAKLKAQAFLSELSRGELLITADTIVFLDGKVLGKPVDLADAEKLLRELSGKEHQVVSGVCLTSAEKQVSFYALTNVRFRELSEDEIRFYLYKFQPLDKAGAYGIQEWIGYIGISHIEGSFYNVMGLPVQKLYEEILRF